MCTHHDFQDCDTAAVFAKVTSTATSSEVRSLWARVSDEIQRDGIDAAISYLDSEFDDAAMTLARELERHPKNG